MKRVQTGTGVKNLLPWIIGYLAFAPKINAQNAATDSYDQIINFNNVTKTTDKPIPFDRNFILSVDKLRKNSVKSVFAYRVYSVEGHRDLRDDENGIPIYMSPDTNKVMLLFPPIRPGKDFDVLIETTVSNEKLALLFGLHQKIQTNDATAATTFDIVKTTFDTKLFRIPVTSFDFNDYNTYLTFYNSSLRSIYTDLLDNGKYSNIPSVADADIKYMIDKLNANKLPLGKIYDLQKLSGANLAPLKFGYRTVVNELYDDDVDQWEFEKRMKNFSTSIETIDSIRIVLNKLYATTNDAVISGYITSIKGIEDLFKGNLKHLKDDYDKIVDAINKEPRIKEQVWLIGRDTKYNDLQTFSGTVLTTDIGLTNIVVRDNSDNRIYIPRPFVAFEIYFRQVDRGINVKKLQQKKYLTKYDENNLLAHRSLFQHLTLSIALTLGDMTNPDFDNFYSKMSLLVGPSYRFAKALRFGGGVAFIRRMDPNPVFAKKNIIGAGYLSFSADIDFLNTIGKVTSLFIK